MKKIKIGILGCGTVGSAVDKLVHKNHALIHSRTGINLEVTKIADVSPRVHHPKLVRDAHRVTEDPDISIVVEAIGGEHPALEFVLSAIKHGKHIVTSNKELIALHGEQILRAAEEKGVMVRYEAAVGGGIPILGPLSHDLLANDITEVFGIVNGTTNYILSKMTRDGVEFAEALAEAQKLGYAEANPQKDIGGYDASYKAAILAGTAFGHLVNWKDVSFEGIAAVTQEDIRYAAEIGYVIKLLAVAKKAHGACEVHVHPTLVPKNHPLATVLGPMNAIYVKGNAVGELMFYGPGAGGMATASAVVGDIIAIANAKCQMTNARSKAMHVRSANETVSRYYIRLTAPDRHGVLAGIARAFADEKVSIAAVTQKETIGKTATIVIVIHQTREENLSKAIGRLKKMRVVRQVCNIMRVGI
ncbi:MAG TPA: homoserine dehydrogenase [Candidatus Omnitrophota bacterium]|nr:homoserine dehydrogenase [Candidatus Omnitrophota bacterium]